MSKISELEFARICNGIYEDRETICKHNPIGSSDEILLWMLLSCLISYLSLDDKEMPCFNGTPNAKTYYDAILFVLQKRKLTEFNAAKYLEKLCT
jgi:hypothetical protein